MDIKAAYAALTAKYSDIAEWLHDSYIRTFGDTTADDVELIVLLNTSDEPWENPEVFEKAVVILNNREVIGDMTQEISPIEIAYAVSTMKKNFPDNQFNDSVAAYITRIFDEYGLVVAPPELSFIKHLLPILKLTPGQEAVQKAQLKEIATYIKYKGGVV